jgi:acyl-coenzyme A synthetase/AMP-(fatty) acid ligase
MKVGGIWVAPTEIEACLVTHPLVAECAVVPYTEEGLMLPRAYVVLREPERASPDVAQQLRDYVRSHLSPHKFPRDITFAESLPRTPSGKVDRKQLRSSQ